MKKFKMFASGLFLAGTVALSASGARAQDGNFQKSWYAGIGGGSAVYQINGCAMVGSTVCADDRTAGAFKLFAGRQFSKVYSLEAGWASLSDFGVAGGGKIFTGGADAFFGAAKFNLSGYKKDNVKLFVKAGLNGFQLETPQGEDQGIDWMYGFGGEARLSPEWDVRLEYEKFGLDEADRNEFNASPITANFIYKF